MANMAEIATMQRCRDAKMQYTRSPEAEQTFVHSPPQSTPSSNLQDNQDTFHHKRVIKISLQVPRMAHECAKQGGTRVMDGSVVGLIFLHRQKAKMPATCLSRQPSARVSPGWTRNTTSSPVFVVIAASGCCELQMGDEKNRREREPCKNTCHSERIAGAATRPETWGGFESHKTVL
jgi:hypothetical protein